VFSTRPTSVNAEYEQWLEQQLQPRSVRTNVANLSIRSICGTSKSG
jgi:hypothetical protein